jgi:SWI/SNF-related matrix-associated actin-dependent regulator of chromatin subfamily A-like protein 1
MALFEHQKTGIAFLTKHKKAILADEMGLGKTRQAIMAAEEHHIGAKTLVVCPASLKINWMREIKIVYPDHHVGIISTTDEIDYPTEIDWFIINYDIVEKKLEFINWLIDSKMIDTLILDEAHYIKGKSIRAASIVGGTAIKKKNKGAIKERVKHEGIANKMDRVFVLTGTPILNRPIEMFNLLKAIGHELGKNRKAYSTKYCGGFLKTIIRKFAPPIRYWDESGATNLDELRDKLKDCLLRRKKKDVLDLPEKIVSIMECEMNPEQKKTYDSAWDMYIDFLTANPIPDRNIDNILMARQLVEIQKLKQVCSQAKVDRMISDIGNAIEQDEKVIIFTQYTKTLELLAEKASEIKYDTGKQNYFGQPEMKNIKVVTLSGADKMDARQKAVDDFQRDPETKVFIANITAGGVGINLTEASIVMFADMVWSPEIHKQAEDRAHRIGQEGTVNVYYYICLGTIEEDIVDVLNLKKDIADQILEGTKDRLKSKSTQEVFLRLMAKKQAVHK